MYLIKIAGILVKSFPNYHQEAGTNKTDTLWPFFPDPIKAVIAIQGDQATQGLRQLSLQTVDPSLRTHLGHRSESNGAACGSGNHSVCSSSAVQTSAI